MNNEIKSPEERMLHKRGNVWHYEFTFNGRRYRGSTKQTQKKAAEKVLVSIRASVMENRDADIVWDQFKRSIPHSDIPVDCGQIWETFIKRTSLEGSAKRMNAYMFRLKSFCDWIKKNYSSEVTYLSDVTEKHATEWFGEIRNGNMSSATKNEYLFILKNVFNSLGRDYGIIENPFNNIKRVGKDGISREAFTPEELDLISENATGWIYDICLTALSTGLREGDICLLEKKSVNLKSGWITLSTRKTGANVDIPIMSDLRTHLENVMSVENKDYPEYSQYVYPYLAYMYTNSQYKISAGIKSFFKKIGITGTEQKDKKRGRAVSVKDIHSFRHTFVYLAAINGIPLPIVQSIVGHASPEMTKHYMDHAKRKEKEMYINTMPQYMGAKKPAKPPKKERLLRILSHISSKQFNRFRNVLIKEIEAM